MPRDLIVTNTALPIFDVLGLGVAVIDQLLYVDTYPFVDTKVPIRSQQRRLGGLTAIALAAAARLGCKAAYAGVLGSNEPSDEVARMMVEQHIDVTYLVHRDGARPIESTVIVASDPPTRTIPFDANVVCGADPLLPDPDVIRSARVLLVDNWGIEGMVRAAQIARTAQIPVVADLEFALSPLFPTLLELADHLIVSYRFAAQITGETSPEAAARRLWRDSRQVVAVTCGAEGAWYVTGADAPACYQPAFAVKTVDTTGCGDVFHGAYGAALTWEMDTAARIRFAAAAAAIKAAQPGGPAGLPTRSIVEAFLRDHQSP
ncbi:MAG: hypothetical protein IT324_33200 [Anaerolineae bacterium]|nr:hypothetical protein [Anaerolineae bacterium]